MCFSAEASFAASGALLVIGGASLTSAKKTDKMIAVVPFLFGIQQAFEGFQWLSLDSGSPSLVAGYGFLIFAYIVWPLYVPICVYVLDKKRRERLKWFIFLGGAVALYLIGLLFKETLSIRALTAGITYTFKFPFDEFVNTAYLISVFGPLFISSKPIFKWFGLIIGIFAIIAWIFFAVAFTSVWCYFSAAMSVIFFLYVRSKRLNK